MRNVHGCHGTDGNIYCRKDGMYPRPTYLHLREATLHSVPLCVTFDRPPLMTLDLADTLSRLCFARKTPHSYPPQPPKVIFNTTLIDDAACGVLIYSAQAAHPYYHNGLLR